MVQRRPESHEDRFHVLSEMENTGGEPDVTDYEEVTDKTLFMDCSAESPSGRRSLCYDKAALH